MIEIPKSNAIEEQENELAQWVLDNLKDRKEVQILQRTEGCCAGNWVGSLPNEKWHVSSFEAVNNVVRALSSTRICRHRVLLGSLPNCVYKL